MSCTASHVHNDVSRIISNSTTPSIEAGGQAARLITDLLVHSVSIHIRKLEKITNVDQSVAFGINIEDNPRLRSRNSNYRYSQCYLCV